jgi:hypothetical protein
MRTMSRDGYFAKGTFHSDAACSLLPTDFKVVDWFEDTASVTRMVAFRDFLACPQCSPGVIEAATALVQSWVRAELDAARAVLEPSRIPADPEGFSTELEDRSAKPDALLRSLGDAAEGAALEEYRELLSSSTLALTHFLLSPTGMTWRARRAAEVLHPERPVLVEDGLSRALASKRSALVGALAAAPGVVLVSRWSLNSVEEPHVLELLLGVAGEVVVLTRAELELLASLEVPDELIALEGAPTPEVLEALEVLARDRPLAEAFEAAMAL